MKNKILFSVMLCLACTFSINVNAQQDYYWYDGAKILLERGNQEYIIYDDALLLQSDKEKIVEKGDVSYPEMANLKWGITKPNAIIEDLEHVFYMTPSYKDTEGGNIYVTHCFYVKLKQEEDIVLLQNMTKQYNVDFEQDVDLPLWYILTCGLPSVFNALELANIFYETKLFAASEPEFIGCIYPDNDVNAIDQATNHGFEPFAGAHKIIKDGQVLILRNGKTYTMQGQEVK